MYLTMSLSPHMLCTSSMESFRDFLGHTRAARTSSVMALTPHAILAYFHPAQQSDPSKRLRTSMFLQKLAEKFGKFQKKKSTSSVPVLVSVTEPGIQGKVAFPVHNVGVPALVDSNGAAMNSDAARHAEIVTRQGFKSKSPEELANDKDNQLRMPYMSNGVSVYNNREIQMVSVYRSEEQQRAVGMCFGLVIWAPSGGRLVASAGCRAADVL